MGTLTINQGGADDTIVITATGSDSADVTVNGTLLGHFVNITHVDVSGGGGNDTLIIANPTGGLFAPVSGISYNGGGQSGDALLVVGGVADYGESQAGATPDAGTIDHFITEQQLVTVNGSSGTFTLTFNGQTTAALAYNASTATVEAALTSLSTIGAGNVSVSKFGSIYDVGFVGALAYTDVSQMTAVASGGATATVQTAFNGGECHIAFSGLAPVYDTVSESVFRVHGTAGNDAMTVSDGAAVYGTQTTTISSPTFESIGVGHKGDTFIDGGTGGTDNVTFSSLTAAGGLNALVLNNVDAVTQTGAITVPQLEINASGDVTLNNAANHVGALSASARSLYFADADPLTIGHVYQFDGITTSNTNTSFGVKLIADSLDIQQQINAGATRSVLLQPLSAGQSIDLGGADTAGHLGLTDAELDRIVAGELQIVDFSDFSGGISVTAPISPAGASNLDLLGIDGTVSEAGGGITVANLQVTGTGGVALNDPSNNVGTLAGGAGGTGFSFATVNPLTIGTVLGEAGVSSIDHNITIAADNLNILQQLNAGSSGDVFLHASTSGRPINLGGADTVGRLGLTDAELDKVTAHDLSVGGTVFGGDITISSQITANNHYDELGLLTNGGVFDGTAGEQTDITVNSLALLTNTGIGSLDDIDTAVSNLAFFNSTSGDADVTNTGTLTLTAAGNLGGAVAVVVGGGALTVTGDVPASGNILLQTTDSAAAGEDLTVLSGANVQSTGSAVQLVAGDNLTVQAGSNVSAATNLQAEVDFLGGDSGVGGIATLNGTVSGSPIDIFGQTDNDVLIGGSANEVFHGGGGADNMQGGAGNDTYIVDDSGDVVTEGANAGIDTVNSSVSYTLPANVENLVMQSTTDLQGYGNGLANTITGNSGNNLIDGGAGADIMAGSGGNDTYFVDNAGDAVTEAVSAGTDTVFASINYTLTANVENLVLQGSADLQGYGNSLVNAIVGNSGNNLLDGGSGADSMTGGAGNDVYFADNAGDAALENANEGNDSVFATANFTLGANVESLILQGAANLQGYGNGLANTLYGNTGDNLLNGFGGVDLMAGGAGNDVYFVDNSSDSCFEVANQGNDSVFATCSYGLAADVESLILQGSGDFQAYGNNQANTIYGNTGNNLINAGAGIDLMAGGAGNDVYYVDDPSDVCFEVAGQGNDAVFATCNYGLAADVETLILQGSADLQGYGNNTANTIYGNAGNNLLNGGGGADTMVGGAGNDVYFVDNAGDGIIENTNEGNDAVFAGVSYVLGANVEGLVLQGGGNLDGIGNGIANSIAGNTGINTLNGGAGADQLTGNAGNDIFEFNVGQANGDTVVDFVGNGASAGDALRFVGYGPGATFTNIDATHWQVTYNAGASHDIITFSNSASIHASDFSFI